MGVEVELWRLSSALSLSISLPIETFAALNKALIPSFLTHFCKPGDELNVLVCEQRHILGRDSGARGGGSRHCFADSFFLRRSCCFDSEKARFFSLSFSFRFFLFQNRVCPQQTRGHAPSFLSRFLHVPAS